MKVSETSRGHIIAAVYVTTGQGVHLTLTFKGEIMAQYRQRGNVMRELVAELLDNRLSRRGFITSMVPGV